MKELGAIIEYEKARRAVKSLTKEIGLSMSRCNEYYRETCVFHVNKYSVWERDVDGLLDEPEFITPCDHCKKTFLLFKERSQERAKFGIAKRRISALARPHIINPDNQ